VRFRPTRIPHFFFARPLNLIDPFFSFFLFARPPNCVQVEEVGQAHPRILETVETMVKKGKWTVPGYKEKFGDLSLM
jgi:hypothetical protein